MHYFKQLIPFCTNNLKTYRKETASHARDEDEDAHARDEGLSGARVDLRARGNRESGRTCTWGPVTTRTRFSWLWCVQVKEHIRPSVRTIVEMLEEKLEVPSPPTPRLLDAIPAELASCSRTVAMQELRQR